MSKFKEVWMRAKTKLKVIYYLRLGTKKFSRFVSEDLSVKLINSQTQKEDLIDPTTEFISQKMPFLIISPSHKLKVFWNSFMAISLLYTAIVMPFALTFLDYSTLDTWGMIEIFLDIIFFVDLVINFNSAYFDQEGILITDRKTITINYLRTWFLIDLVACFPFNAVGVDNSGASYSTHDYNNFLRLLRLPRLYRLFRVVRLLKMFKHYKNSEILEKIQDFLSIKHSVMKLLTSSLSIILCVHLMTCFWYYSSKIEGFNPDTWVSRSGIDPDEYSTLYIISLYWTITTLCTVGYGDVHAQTNLEKVLSIGWMIFSVYFLSFVIGSLSSMLASMDTKENALVSKLAIIDEFSKEAKLSRSLRSRLRYALRYSTEKTGFSWTDKQNIFNELPKHLRFEVAMAMHHGAALNLDFFKGKDEVVISSIIPFLKPIFVSANEFVYRKNEYAEEIYFIVRGRISYVFGKDSTKLTSMQRGSYFGDIEVMLQIPRKYSSKTVRDCELLIMSKELLSEIIEEYPKVWEELKVNAMKRHGNNEKTVVEMQVLSFLMKDGVLQQVNIPNFKNTVNKKLKQREERDKLKRRSVSLTNSSTLSLRDLYDKLEGMCSVITNLEREVELLNLAKPPNGETESCLDDLSIEKIESESSSLE